MHPPVGGITICTDTTLGDITLPAKNGLSFTVPAGCHDIYTYLQMIWAPYHNYCPLKCLSILMIRTFSIRADLTGKKTVSEH